MGLNEDFVLATGRILKFELPHVMERGHEYKVDVKVKGNGKYIFITLLLVDPYSEQQWWADNDSLDLVKNGGKITLKNKSYQNSWYFPIFENAKLGDYIAFLGMYQDTYDLPTVNRRLIDYKIKSIEVVEDTNIGLHKVTKILGSPYDRKEGIQTYKDRKTAPFQDLLQEAKKEILFVSTSHEFVAKYHKKLIRELIENNIKITVLILEPTSHEIKNKEVIFEIANIRNLSKLIVETLKELCSFKSTLDDQQDKLIIETYDSDVKYSYIVIDPESDNAIIKIEELPGDNPEFRKSYLSYKKDNEGFFQEHWNEINNIKNVKIWDCNLKS